MPPNPAPDQKSLATAAQIRMAIAGLGIALDAVAERAGVTDAEVLAAVRDGSAPPDATARIRQALEAAGATFLQGAGRGATVYVRTDVRPRPEIALGKGLRYGSPKLHLCPRWMGQAEIAWGPLGLGTVEGAGDFVRLNAHTEQGLVGPLYFEGKDKVVPFLTEALVEQGRNDAPTRPDAKDLVSRYLAGLNHGIATVAVNVTPGETAEVAVTLTPAPDLEEHLKPDLYSRGPVTLEQAQEWLQEGGMMARLHRDNGAWMTSLLDIHGDED